MKCQYCGNEFKTLSSLNNHIKSAKYCLKLRNKSSTFECKGCEKTFSSKYWLNMHQQSCVSYNKNLFDINHNNDLFKKDEEIIKKDEEIKELKKTIRELQDKLENVAIKAVSRSTTTNQTQINNYIQKLELTTDEYIKAQVPQLTIEHIKKGPKGYAEYALKHPLNNRLICVDYSRRKVKYKDSDGNVITDPEMSNITQKLFESIKSRNKELIMDFIMESRDTLSPEVQMEIMTDMGDYIAMVNRGAVGDKTELYHDFVKNMCSQSVV
jgi:hypothetical protein